MADKEESSVLFNLKELMGLQEDRIKQETEAKRKAEEEAIAAAQEQARREAEEVAARRRAEEEARMAEERRLQEQRDRADREKHEAELRVRLELEAKARAEEQERILEHERHLAALKVQEKSRAWPKLVAASVAVVLSASLGFYFGVVKPAEERELRAKNLARQEAQERQRLAEESRIEREKLAAEAEAARRAAEAAAKSKPSVDRPSLAAEDGSRPSRHGGRGHRSKDKPSSKSTSKGSSTGKSDDPLAGLEGL